MTISFVKRVLDEWIKEKKYATLDAHLLYKFYGHLAYKAEQKRKTR